MYVVEIIESSLHLPMLFFFNSPITFPRKIAVICLASGSVIESICSIFQAIVNEDASGDVLAMRMQIQHLKVFYECLTSSHEAYRKNLF